jgi:uncharacterized protein YxjI
MVIQVVEKIGTIGDKYDIAINDKRSYNVDGQSIPFFTSFYLTKESKNLISIFKSSFSVLPKYKIYFNDEKLNNRKEPLIFKTISCFRNSYECTFDKDVYEFFAHKGLKYSIFKNGNQVAGFSGDRWNIMDEDGFLMECDNDSPKELFSSFIIIMDNIYGRKIKLLGGLLNYNLGVLWEAKEYDKEWKSE